MTGKAWQWHLALWGTCPSGSRPALALSCLPGAGPPGDDTLSLPWRSLHTKATWPVTYSPPPSSVGGWRSGVRSLSAWRALSHRGTCSELEGQLGLSKDTSLTVKLPHVWSLLKPLLLTLSLWGVFYFGGRVQIFRTQHHPFMSPALV